MSNNPILRRELLALVCLMASSRIGLSQVAQRGSDRAGSKLKVDDTVGDLLRHPAFTGFARKLLPWDDRAYDETMTLGAMGALLPYHSHFDGRSAVEALNLLIDDAKSGRDIHFDIHSKRKRREQTAKASTGLFFHRGRPGAPFAIVAPGGGFSYVGSVHEGFPLAAAIARAGCNAFVLKYRTGQGAAVATQDLAVAISFIFRNAEALSVGTRGYSLWGSSAGARMAASIGSHGVAHFRGGAHPKPSTVVMAYTAHSDVSDREPPTFAVVGALDHISPPRSMESRINALHRMGTEVSYRVYDQVGHGFGLGIGTNAEGWIDDAIRFWKRHQPR